MGQVRSIDTRRGGMASRWRRRRMCLLVAERPVPAALRDLSAGGAFLETAARPAIGSRVELRHPEAGTIAAEVRALAADGIAIRFDADARAVAFAMAAIAADMSRPA
jgi:hypothetical protein